MLYEIVQFSFEAAIEKASVTNLMAVVWKTVPCSRSSKTEDALSEPGSAPCLGKTKLREHTRQNDAIYGKKFIKFLFRHKIFTSLYKSSVKSYCSYIVFQCRLNFLHFNFCSTAAVTASDIRDTFYGRTVRQKIVSTHEKKRQHDQHACMHDVRKLQRTVSVVLPRWSDSLTVRKLV